jgi:hypothetical protein
MRGGILRADDASDNPITDDPAWASILSMAPVVMAKARRRHRQTSFFRQGSAGQAGAWRRRPAIELRNQESRVPIPRLRDNLVLAATAG